MTVSFALDNRFMIVGERINPTGKKRFKQALLERDMDYIICKTHQECNEHAKRVLEEDQYDIITLYNGNYDGWMHRYGPESQEALDQLRDNAKVFAELSAIAKKVWAGKNGVAAFLPDHGCHEIDGGCGSYGLDMQEDMNVIHFYGIKE